MKKKDNRLYVPELESAIQEVTSEPSLYQVYMHNDDYTPMEWVVGVLESQFFMDRRHATATMLAAHLNGKALCGRYTRDVAESKISAVIEQARNQEYPLVCSMEAEE